MKRIILLSLLALIVLLSAACGSSAPAAEPTAASSDNPAPTSAAATQPPPAAGSATEVDITLADNTIDSTLTEFKVGVPYTFVIKNTGRHDHDFNISQPISVTGSLDASLSSALLAVTKDQLPIGGGTTVEYTFPDSAVDMQLEFSCLIKRHYDDGMRLAISVTK